MPRPTVDTENIEATLGVGAAVDRRRRVRRALLAAGLLLAAGVAAFFIVRSLTAAVPVVYRTEPVTRAPLTISVTATGSLQPLRQVNVGTEISGIIESVAVDDNDSVRAGQVLAIVNTDKLSAQAEQARASLRVAEAALQQSRATLLEARNTLGRLEQVRELSGGRVPSPLELEAAQAAVARAEAEEASRTAAIAQSRATLAGIESDLAKATIRSPIDGIVLDRQIDPGQTVAASFQTPTLFTLAEDLEQMKLSVDVDEADVGSVQVGQPATFTVDAYPGRTFESEVISIGNLSQTSGGVVTYETVLRVHNPDLLLKPGMTATADITVTAIDDALLVPNAALRYVPENLPVDPASEEAPARRGGLLGSLLPRPPAQRPPPPAGPDQRVWVLENDAPAAVEVRVGATDGIHTRVLDGELAPGTSVIVDSISAGQ
jgi:HlyD family secretion protein